MSKLFERLEVPAYATPWQYLNRAICLISDDQAAEIVHLRVPLLGGAGPAIQKDVAVKYSTGAGSGIDRPWTLRWEPVGGGPYPTFEGSLRIDASGLVPALVIEGDYTPPLGAAGQAFDAVVGSRVASIAALEFLRSIAAQMHHEHDLEQASKL